jgi:hypothetical protein
MMGEARRRERWMEVGKRVPAVGCTNFAQNSMRTVLLFVVNAGKQ